jgi:hypothetical protein
MERELGEMNVKVYLVWEMIVVQLSYNFRSTLTFFFLMINQWIRFPTYGP